MSQDVVEVEIDDDYGRPIYEWLEDQGLYLVQTDQVGGDRSGYTKFIICDSCDNFYEYKVDYRSNGFVVWNTSGNTVEATRCYRKVKMVPTYYFENHPD